MITNEYDRTSATRFWAGIVLLIGIGVILAMMYRGDDGDGQAASTGTAPTELVKPATTGAASSATTAAVPRNQERK